MTKLFYDFQGAWSGSVLYARTTVQGEVDTLDCPVVSYLNVAYMLTGTATLNVNPATDTSNWTVVGVLAGDGTGTVTSVSVVSANGLGGTVATATTTPAITLTTSVSGVLKGNGTAISAAVAGTDYSGGTSALATGILKSTTSTGELTIAVAGDFPTLNQNTTGNAATATNITGGAAGEVLYQSGANVTAKLANASGFLQNDGAGALSWAAAGGTGTVTDFVFTDGNGFAGVVTDGTTTPTLELSTTVTGLLKGNGTAISAAVAGTDYSGGTSALATGILKSTTSTGELTIAVAGDFPTLNQNTTGNAATATNITGGAAGEVLYQSGANVTAKLANASGFLQNDGAGALSWAAAGGTGTVTDFVFTDGNGFAGVVTDGTTTPTLELSTTVTGLLKGNGTAISAAVAGTDYSGGTSALATGILKSTTSTGELTIAVAGDFPTLNQNTTGNAATATNITGGAAGEVLYQSGANVTAKLANASGFLQNDGAGALSWAAAGGTGTVTDFVFTDGNGFAGVVTDGTTTPTLELSTTVTGLLKGNGTAISAAVAGTDYLAPGVTVAQGGTGITTTTAYGLLTGGTTATGAFQNAGTGTAGQVYVSGGASALGTWTTLSSISYTFVTDTSATMVANNGYVANNAGLVTLTLPATAAAGSIIAVGGLGAGGWAIAQNSGQNIVVSPTSTTVGVGGSLASTTRYDSIMLLCVVADTTWIALGAPQSTGLTIV